VRLCVDGFGTSLPHSIPIGCVGLR
jgi:hypothetical protein